VLYLYTVVYQLSNDPRVTSSVRRWRYTTTFWVSLLYFKLVHFIVATWAWVVCLNQSLMVHSECWGNTLHTSAHVTAIYSVCNTSKAWCHFECIIYTVYACLKDSIMVRQQWCCRNSVATIVIIDESYRYCGKLNRAWISKKLKVLKTDHKT